MKKDSIRGGYKTGHYKTNDISQKGANEATKQGTINLGKRGNKSG